MKIKIYSRENCPYCVKLKDWFKERNIEFLEVVLDNQEAIQEFLLECPGLKTVPQILVDDVLIFGGHDGFMKSDMKKVIETFHGII